MATQYEVHASLFSFRVGVFIEPPLPTGIFDEIDQQGNSSFAQSIVSRCVVADIEIGDERTYVPLRREEGIMDGELITSVNIATRAIAGFINAQNGLSAQAVEY